MKINTLNRVKITAVELLIMFLALGTFFAVKNIAFTPKTRISILTSSEVMVYPKTIATTKPVAKSAQAVPDALTPAGSVVTPLPITPPTLINQILPDYPKKAIAEEAQGVVLLSLTVDDNGKVVEAKVKNSSGFAVLDVSAVQAATHWIFIPAKRGTKTIASTFEVPVNFVLNES